MSDTVEVQATVVVDIEFREATGCWYATSGMARGLSVVGRTRDECVAQLPNALTNIAQFCRDAARVPAPLDD